MSTDHEGLADAQDERADRMQQESDRVGGVADEAREKLEQANSEKLIPEGLGRADPAYREPAPSDEEGAHEDAEKSEHAEDDDSDDDKADGR